MTTPGTKLMLHAPPQYGKTIFLILFISWAFGVCPTIKVYYQSNSVDHSSEIGAAVVAIMQSQEYAEMFPGAASRISRDASSRKFSTRAREQLRDGQPSFMALGLLVGLTGKGPDILLTDDPYANNEDAQSTTVNRRIRSIERGVTRGRMGEESCRMVVFHRYSPGDFGGYLLETGEFEYVRLPAIADEMGDDPTGRQPGELLSPRRSLEWLEKQREDDPVTFAGLFQGLPKVAGQEFLQRTDFQIIGLHDLPRCERFVRFWDLAVKVKQSSDFTAGALVGIGAGQNMYVPNVQWWRAVWPDAREMIVRQAIQDLEWCEARGASYAMGVEDVAWQDPMIQDLLRHEAIGRAGIQIYPMRPKGDKRSRASGWAARGRAGQVYLVENNWRLEEWLDLALAFDGLGLVPDDPIDAVTGAYQLSWHLAGDMAGEQRRTVVPGSEEHLYGDEDNDDEY